MSNSGNNKVFKWRLKSRLVCREQFEKFPATTLTSKFCIGATRCAAMQRKKGRMQENSPRTAIEFRDTKPRTYVVPRLRVFRIRTLNVICVCAVPVSGPHVDIEDVYIVYL